MNLIQWLYSNEERRQRRLGNTHPKENIRRYLNYSKILLHAVPLVEEGQWSEGLPTTGPLQLELLNDRQGLSIGHGLGAGVE